MKALRRGSRLGKYKLLSTLGEGGFAKVYKARDEVEGREVALKVPHSAVVEGQLPDILREIRIMVRLDHPNILPILNADIIDDRPVIAYPLGVETLASRMQRRMSGDRALSIFEDLVAGAAYAHEHRVIHCDIKPANIILFDDGPAMLADFGIAKVTNSTGVLGSGSGTVGYLSPEQALGRPSFRSDVFSLGLIAYRLFSGQLPRWPYEWPPKGIQRLRSRLTRNMVDFIRRSIEVNERRRFANAARMQSAYDRLGEVLR